jgi:hypothetical protein
MCVIFNRTVRYSTFSFFNSAHLMTRSETRAVSAFLFNSLPRSECFVFHPEFARPTVQKRRQLEKKSKNGMTSVPVSIQHQNGDPKYRLSQLSSIACYCGTGSGTRQRFFQNLITYCSSNKLCVSHESDHASIFGGSPLWWYCKASGQRERSK